MRKYLAAFLKQENTAMANVARTIANMHPLNVLKRGYSITRVNGKVITGTAQVKPSDVMETTLTDGAVYSQVNSIIKSPEI